MSYITLVKNFGKNATRPYGRLIALLLSSSIVFTAKNIILENDDKEISNFKSFDKVIEYFPMIQQEIFEEKWQLHGFLKD